MRGTLEGREARSSRQPGQQGQRGDGLHRLSLRHEESSGHTRYEDVTGLGQGVRNTREREDLDNKAHEQNDSATSLRPIVGIKHLPNRIFTQSLTLFEKT